MHGRYRTVKQLCSEEPEVRAVSKHPRLETRLENLEGKMAEMDKYVNIMSMLEFICKQTERGRFTSPRTRGQVECFTCRGSHFQKNCHLRKDQDTVKQGGRDEDKKRRQRVQFVGISNESKAVDDNLNVQSLDGKSNSDP